MTTIKIATLNVNGLNDDIKCASIMNQLKILNCDIIALQETHVIESKIATTRKTWEGQSYWNPAPSSSSSGTAILLGPKVKYTSHKKDETGRIITCKISINDVQLQLTNIYGPNDNQHKEYFFNNLTNYMYNIKHSILTGDFNMVEDPNLDRNPPCKSTTYSKGINNLNKVKEAHKLTDRWREVNKQKRTFTWQSRKAGDNTASRLDRIYISDKITYIDQKVIKTAHSDHSIVVNKIIIQSKNPRGPGYYKLNTRILKDPTYNLKMTNTIANLRLNEQNPHTSWDMFKQKIKIYTIKQSKQRKKEINQQIDNLQNKLNTEKDHEVANDISNDILNLHNELDGGVLIRTREATLLNEDKPNKYFYLQEEIRQKQGTITEIHTLDRQEENITNIYKNEDEILKELHRHYTELYKHRPSDETARQYLLDMIDKQLTEQQKRDLDRPITLKEIKEAIQDMKLNKSPGPDGIPIEFYIEFEDIIAPKLLIIFNHIYVNGIQPISHTIGYIRLIFKKGIKELLRNWRGITLLNVDHKILTKIISSRLRKVLPDIIHVDQTCGIPGRMIFDNLYLIRDVIHHAQANHVPTWIVSYDIKNAFDTVNHTYLNNVLGKFNFGEKFINFIKLIYTERKVYVMNNGHFAMPVTMERGMTQGCSLSQYLYEIQEEPLAISIRKDNQIHGYKIPNQIQESKLTLYADDSDSISTKPGSVQRTINHFKTYEKASGCSLNKPKTKGLMIATKQIPDTDFEIEWNPVEGLKALGVVFFEDTQNEDTRNWNQQLKKAEEKLKVLKYRQLSLKGKVNILNSMILSKGVHLSTVISMPSDTWCDKDGHGIKQMIFQYLWDNANPEPIQREIIFLPKERGGLGLLNLTQQGQALRLKYFFQLTDNNIDKPWVNIGRYWIGTRIYNFKAEWHFLIDNYNNSRKYIPDSNDKTPRHYRMLLKDFREYSNELTKVKAPISKDIYNIIRKEDNDKHGDIFATHAWDNNHTLNINGKLKWEQLWGNTYKSYNVGPIRDYLYKILHNSLPSKVRIKKTEEKKRPGRKFNVTCSVCNRAAETLLHLFAECQHAKNIWRMYKPIYTKLLPNRPYIYEHNVLTKNVQHKMCPKRRKLIITITEIILEEIWKTRNKAWKEGIEPRKEISKNRINRNITYLLKTHYKENCNNNNIDKFKSNFSMVQALCSVDEQQRLEIHLPP